MHCTSWHTLLAVSARRLALSIITEYYILGSTLLIDQQQKRYRIIYLLYLYQFNGSARTSIAYTMNTFSSSRAPLLTHLSTNKTSRRAFHDTGIHSHDTMMKRYYTEYGIHYPSLHTSSNSIVGTTTRRGRPRLIPARGFFNSLFGNGNGMSGDSDSTSNSNNTSVDPDPVRDWSDEDIDEVVIMTWTDPSTSVEYNIVYRNGGLVDARGVEMLCDKINWPRRPQHKVDAALKNSFLVASLTLEEPGCTEPEKRRLIGTARCTSDGAFNATLWDVMVDPEFQGYGLGKALLELMVRSLLKRDISNITLFADSNVVEFYERLGFDCDPEGIKGMFFRFGY